MISTGYNRVLNEYNIYGGYDMMKLYCNNFSTLFDAQRVMRSSLQEYENSYTLSVELPGFKKENIKISIEEDLLVIEAAREFEKEENYLIQERLSGELKRSFVLKDMCLEGIKAKYEDGILTITVLKDKEKNEKKIITIE